MFCVSDRLHPTYHHHRQHPTAVFIPAAYDEQAVTRMMMSMMPSGQTLMKNVQPVSAMPLQFASSTLSEYRTATSPNLRPSPTKLKAGERPQVKRTAVRCRDGPGSGVTSFRIADILDGRVGSSGRRVHNHRASSTLERIRPSALKTCVVRPWDERRSSSSSVSLSSSSSDVEERNDDINDDEATEIDVDDASCTLPPGTTSDVKSNSDTCPLGALLRMTNQTNFDECANRLQECFTDGRYILTGPTAAFRVQC